MIPRRDIATAIILYLVTCGLYSIIWFITLTDDSNIASGEPTAEGGVAFLLSLVTCGLYGIYWSYKLGEKIDIAKNQRGMYSSNSGVLYLVLFLFGFGIVTYVLAQNELNKIAEMN